MARKEHKWLLGELPVLVSEGTLDEQSAEKLRLKYGEDGAAAQRLSTGAIVVSVIGALLIGLGIIMMLAYNWQQLPRFLRIVLALLPMAVMQVLVVLGFARKWQSDAWREATALLWALTVGATVAMISQIYHISGNLENFTLIWACLIIPVLFFTQAVTVVGVYLGILLAWATTSQLNDGVGILFWPMAALVLWPLYKAMRTNIYGARAIWMQWLTALAFVAALGITLEKYVPGLWIVLYSSAFAVLYMFGGSRLAEPNSFWQRPLHTIGTGGIIILSYMLTYGWPWREIGWCYRYRGGRQVHVWAEWFDTTTVIVVFLFAIILLIALLIQKKKYHLFYGSMPLIAATGYFMVTCGERANDVSYLTAMLFNAYLFILGLATLVRGIWDRRLGAVNGGMLILILLIITRFFDSESGLLAKGGVFIVLGAIFLAVNLTFRKFKREVKS